MRIDFHSHVSNPLDYACRLIRKALAAQCRVMVCHQDPEQRAQLDTLLWAFSPTDFLPHVVVDHPNYPLAQHTPVLLTLASDHNLEQAGWGQGDILINLSETTLARYDQYQRLIEIVPSASETATQAGRERYRFYQQQGHQLNHIVAK